jgi:hypothetical protein
MLPAIQVAHFGPCGLARVTLENLKFSNEKKKKTKKTPKRDRKHHVIKKHKKTFR